VNTGFATQPPSIHVAPISAITSPNQQEWIRPPGLKLEMNCSIRATKAGSHNVSSLFLKDYFWT
jgi:hypothetical protein